VCDFNDVFDAILNICVGGTSRSARCTARDVAWLKTNSIPSSVAFAMPGKRERNAMRHWYSVKPESRVRAP
jgi:hypothetical protein